MRRLFLSFFGVGYLRPAPGTWGSLAAVIVALPVINISLLHFMALLGVVAGVGIGAIRDEMAAGGAHDPSWIVIDEVAGQWIALLPVAFGVWMMEVHVLDLWPGIVAAFLFFRLFDVWKPGLVGRLDRMETADSIMSDDIAAGIYAALSVSALAAIVHAMLIFAGSDAS